MLGPVAGDGLFTNDGEIWREQRQRIQPAFHLEQIAVYWDLLIDAVARRLTAWGPGDWIEVNAEMRTLTLDIGARTLLGVEVDG